MSYSAFFTSGLSLPLGDFESSALSRPPPPQINVLPGTPARPRSRKRRSSLTIATSPISSIKSPMKSANESLRVALCSPREGTYLDTFHTAPRPKVVRRQTPRTASGLPSLPAPTLPLPMLPSTCIGFSHPSLTTSSPGTPIDEAYPSSPITSETFVSHLSNPNAFLRLSNPSRKLPSPPSSLPFPRSPSSSESVRGPLSPSLHVGNMNVPRDMTASKDLDMGLPVEQKDVPVTAWFDDDEDMKENDVEA